MMTTLKLKKESVKIWNLVLCLSKLRVQLVNPLFFSLTAVNK